MKRRRGENEMTCRQRKGYLRQLQLSSVIPHPHTGVNYSQTNECKLKSAADFGFMLIIPSEKRMCSFIRRNADANQ